MNLCLSTRSKRSDINAAQKGNLNVIRVLRKTSGDFSANKSGRPPMYWVTTHGNYHAIKVLKKLGARDWGAEKWIR